MLYQTDILACYKIKKRPTGRFLISLYYRFSCSPAETRTQSNRTKIWCATITPQGYHKLVLRAQS